MNILVGLVGGTLASLRFRVTVENTRNGLNYFVGN